MKRLGKYHDKIVGVGVFLAGITVLMLIGCIPEQYMSEGSLTSAILGALILVLVVPFLLVLFVRDIFRLD